MLKNVAKFYLGLFGLFIILLAGLFLARVLLVFIALIFSNPVFFLCVGLVVYFIYKNYKPTETSQA